MQWVSVIVVVSTAANEKSRSRPMTPVMTVDSSASAYPGREST